MVSHAGDKRYEVRKYTIDDLIDILAAHPDTSPEVVRKKAHIDYFREYFGPTGVNAETILVEYGYIDRDFLEDHASFYVRCFHDYASVCRRLHFFSERIEAEDFSHLLQGTADPSFPETLRSTYLGFIVAKPLPKAVIGRTCLKTYESEGCRHFPITQEYKAHLFGFELKIRETLAFQEQDSVAAACASSTLWSAFQGTGKQFQHHIPSPVEITRAALARFPMDERDLPNHGLFTWQMAHAISSVGLVPYPIRINDKISDTFCLQSSIYAYLQGGIPIPLLVDLRDWANSEDLGGHAVAVTGYRLGRGAPTSYGPTHFLLKATRIDKFYAHDDGIGPFARMELETVTVANRPADCVRLTTSWRDMKGNKGNVYAYPQSMLVPLYHKIRIPFRKALNAVTSFDAFTKLPEVNKELNLAGELEWDVYLTDVNKLKSEVAESEHLQRAYRESVLLEGMPKYIWRATAETKGQKVLDLILDATDIEHGPLMVRAIEHDADFGDTLRRCTRVESIMQPFAAHSIYRLLQWFAKQPLP